MSRINDVNIHFAKQELGHNFVLLRDRDVAAMSYDLEILHMVINSICYWIKMVNSG